MIILGIETSGYCGSVAVSDDDKVIGEIFFDTGLKHSIKIIPSIHNLLNTVGLSRQDIDGVAVSEGPGSYTSLRVGISAAKGIAYSLGVPLTGVSTLHSLALTSIESGFPICSVIDAKKGQLYSAFFRYEGGALERVSDDRIVGVDELCEEISETIVLIGDGLNLYKSTFMDKINGLVLYAPQHLCNPRASSCAVLGFSNFMKEKKDEAFSLVPRYIRQADAQAL